MASNKVRSLKRSFAITLSFAIFLAGFTTPVSAQSQVLERPATHWGNVYAAPATSNAQSPKPKVAYLEKKSKFIVKYNNFPEWTKAQFQAAVDVWSENFESKVPIYIEAKIGRAHV
jgi:hypothetical protein